LLHRNCQADCGFGWLLSARSDSVMVPAAQSWLGGCRFFQIGYVVGDIDHAAGLFTGMFGATLKDLTRDMRDQHGEPSLIANLSHVLLNGVEIELIEPRVGWPSVYGDGTPLSKSAIALHHFGFMADNDDAWDAANAVMEASGAPAAMAADLLTVRLTYFDTRASLGHYTEIVQRRTLQQDAGMPADQGSNQ
jgi:catechol 2,3-dioxygenase-like lactoylglutathione lyase family enzyme